MVLAGLVWAVIAGPPCETFSKARQNPAPRNRLRPRVLRSSKWLWGLPFRSPGEWEHIDLSNALMRTTVLFGTVCAGTRTGFLHEHPRDPRTGHLPSCWRFPEIQNFRNYAASSANPLVEFHDFDQCCYGAQSVKPTTFLTLNLPLIGARLAAHPSRGRCNHPGGHLSLEGVDDAGVFRTSSSKQYPTELCQLIADAVCCQFAVSQGMNRWHALDRVLPALEQFYVPLDPYADDQVWNRFASDRAS